MTPRSSLSVHTQNTRNSQDVFISKGSEMSFRNVLQRGSIDLHAYQRSMPDRVAAYFRGICVRRIAMEYGVSERTAQYWKDGVVVPNGAKMALVAVRDPVGFAHHFAGEIAA